MIKIEQMGLFRRRLGKSAAAIGNLFKQNDVFGYIDGCYEFLHIQGAQATYKDITSYMAAETKADGYESMDDFLVNKYRLASEYVIKMVVVRIAENHDWSINDTLEKIAVLEIFDGLQDPDTSLWTTNPVDLAEMVETELRGETIDPACYFP